VTSFDGLNYVITAAGGLANADLPQFTAAGTGSLTTIRNGTGNTIETLALGGTSPGTLVVSFDAVASSNPALNFTARSAPTAADVLAHLNGIPALAGNVVVIGPAGGPFLIVLSGSFAATNVAPSRFTFTSGTGTTATFTTTSAGTATPAAPALTFVT